MIKEFTPEEYDLVRKSLGKWGRNVRGVRLKWKTMFPTLTGKTKLGYYSLLHSLIYEDTIFLNMKFKLVPEQLLDTIAHEMIHYHQREDKGLFRYMFEGFRLWRKWTIELPAEAEEEAISILMKK